ncbi:MAG: Fe-S cluster assembly protein SufD [Anaerolineales bacterium]|nr:Fe-S cluster assembly protein SufD [Anaerolineales bacterium]
MAERTVKRILRRDGTTTGTPASEFPFTQDMIPSQNGKGSPLVREYRQRAWEIYQSLPIPTLQMEAWRRTDLKRLDVGNFRFPETDAYLDLAPVPELLLAPLVADQHGGQITLLPGGVTVELDENLARQGVVFTDYATAEQQHPELLAKILGKIVSTEEGKFAALTGAFARQGILLYVPRNVIVDQPLHAVIWAPGVGLAHLYHTLVYLEDGASATFVQESASPDETGGQTLVGGNVEVHVGANAQLRFVELQSLGRHVWNFTHERSRVERDGNLDWIFGAIGSHLTKNFSELNLDGPGSTGRMSGFYFTDGVQHLDHDTQQNHNAPHTTSDLLFKGALKDTSRSVWQGMIYVAPGAQKTDGYQANRNLVLNPKARADSIPGLEILADDVRCTHGATVGKIDPELVFYLQSRGVPLHDAERLIVDGFFDPIMQRIPYEGVRERFAKAILDKMG